MSLSIARRSQPAPSPLRGAASVGRETAAGGYRMQELIQGIVESYPFQYRRALPATTALTASGR